MSQVLEENNLRKAGPKRNQTPALKHTVSHSTVIGKGHTLLFGRRTNLKINLRQNRKVQHTAALSEARRETAMLPTHSPDTPPTTLVCDL